MEDKNRVTGIITLFCLLSGRGFFKRFLSLNQFYKMAQIALVVLSLGLMAVAGETTMLFRPIGLNGKLIVGNGKVTIQTIINFYFFTFKVFFM